MPLAPIKKQSLQKMVYNRIRRAILTRQIKPGDQIKIAETASNLEVSAIPVREALRQLEVEGLVTFGPQKRIVVNQLSVEDLQDIYSMLIPLEEIALKKCFDRIDQGGIEALEQILRQMSECGGSTSEWLNLNWKFHSKISEIAGSPRLTQILSSLLNSIRPYLSLSFQDSRRMRQVDKEHAEILEAIRGRDWRKGKKAVHNHLANGCKSIEGLLRRDARDDA